jgi:hypothetical protein
MPGQPGPSLGNHRPINLLESRFVILHSEDPGEILLSTALVRCLKNQVEGSFAYSLVREEHRWLLENNTRLDGVFTYRENPKELLDDLRDFLPDYLIDLDGGPGVRRFKNRLKVLDFALRRKKVKGDWMAAAFDTCRLFDVNDDGAGPEFHFPPSDPGLLPSDFLKGYLVLSLENPPGSVGWSEEDIVNLAVMIEKPIVVTGRDTDRDLADRISQMAGCAVFPTCGDISRTQVASLIGESRGLVTFDPFWRFMGEAAGVPTIKPGLQSGEDMAGVVRQARLPFENQDGKHSV